MSEEPRVKDPLLGAELRERRLVFWGGLRERAGQIRTSYCGWWRRLELKECFEDPLCDTALAVLREAPTARAVARAKSNASSRRTRPGGRRRLGENKATSWPRDHCSLRAGRPPDGLEVGMLTSISISSTSRSRLPSTGGSRSGGCRRSRRNPALAFHRRDRRYLVLDDFDQLSMPARSPRHRHQGQNPSIGLREYRQCLSSLGGMAVTQHNMSSASNSVIARPCLAIVILDPTSPRTSTRPYGS